jgi:hypothetical protein
MIPNSLCSIIDHLIDLDFNNNINIYLHLNFAFQDESGPHSPSKSPLRHAAFLPSLQSVGEDEEEAEAAGSQPPEDDDDTVEEAAEHGYGKNGHTEAQAKRKRSSTDWVGAGFN